MKTRFLSLLLLPAACLLALWKGNSYSQDFISPLAEKYQTSIVSVIAMDQENRPIRTGSGFFVDSQGVLATSHHVLEGCARAMVRLGDKLAGEVLDILGDDPGCDLVTAKTSLQGTSPIPLGASDKIAEGEEVVIIGHSAVQKRVFSAGHFLGFRRAANLELLQISASLSAGFSGGPVLNRKGEVLGVATAFADFNRDLNFAVPIRYLRALKPAGANWKSLQKKSVQFYAFITDAKVTQILVARNPSQAGEVTGPLPTRSQFRGGTVYFKDGREVLCDSAWKEGGAVFLVLHGKGYAVSYREEEIDMKKSFDL